MTRPEAVKLGPFVGGLNLLTDSQNIDNTELAECINFEVDLDGSLMSRPAIIETANNSSNSSVRMKIIGRANLDAAGDFLLTCNGSAIYSFNGTTWTFITNVDSDCAVQYNDTVYIIATSTSANPGGRWDGYTFTADATMPRGRAALFHKSRMFVVPAYEVANESRLTFSDTITAVVLTWNAANIIDVAPGDGETLYDLVVYNDNLLLFKSDSIYLLAYDIAPADAVLRQVHDSIGVNQIGCVESVDGSIFFLHEGNVWEMVNYEFKKANQKVPFVLSETPPLGGGYFEEPVWIKRVGDRLLIGFHAKRYSYHLLTRTWSEWQVADIGYNANSGQVFGPPWEIVSSLTTNEYIKYYMSSAAGDFTSFFYMTDRYVPGTKDILNTLDGGAGFMQPENIVCSMQTKKLDFDIPFVWKRLMWWGCHANTGATLQGKAIINNVNQTNDTWADIGVYTWDNLPGTWDNVLHNFTVPDDITAVIQGGASFYKFQKSMRFRTISFKVTIENDGNTLAGPCRLFTLTATVGYKQISGKDAN